MEKGKEGQNAFIFTKTNFLKKFCLNFIIEIDTALHSEKH